MTEPNSTLHSRRFASEDDYERMRTMLAEIVPGAHRGLPWFAGDLDWWRYSADDPNQIERVRLWEATDRLMGFVWVSDDETGIVVQPGNPDVLHDIYAWVEARTQTSSDATPAVRHDALAYDADVEWQRVLDGRSYTRGAEHSWAFRQPVHPAMPAPLLPVGYQMRDMRGDSKADIERRVKLHLAAFPSSTLTVAQYRAVMASRTYRPELDLIAVAPGGQFAAFSNIWLDPVNRLGVFEPVGCDPAYRRRGLARAILAEGLRRLSDLGAATSSVMSFASNTAANRLYAAAGFEHVDVMRNWTKATEGGR